jgi:hypothetical protein
MSQDRRKYDEIIYCPRENVRAAGQVHSISIAGAKKELGFSTLTMLNL